MPKQATICSLIKKKDCTGNLKQEERMKVSLCLENSATEIKEHEEIWIKIDEKEEATREETKKNNKKGRGESNSL